MKKHYDLRRALAVLATGMVLGGMFAATASASVYYMRSNYVAGTVAPYNAGGGVPAQSLLIATNLTSTNFSLSGYGTMGWYGIQGSPDLSTWTTLASVEATDFRWTTSVTNPFGPIAYFRLSQTNSFAGQASCGSCHGDKYTDWSKTRHAVAITEHLKPDGTFIPGHSVSCLPCHTVGYNQPTGYVYDTNAGAANYSSPLANVGCEACHGPAGWHKNSDHKIILPVVSLDPAICGSCHQGAVHPTYQEYTNSLATATAPAGVLVSGSTVTHAIGGHGSASCGFCHSATYRQAMLDEYNDNLAGRPHALNLPASADATPWTASCVTCHDPHSSAQVAQLRNPTFSTNFYCMPNIADSRTVYVTNYNGSITTNSITMNTMFDSLYNPNVQICGQCHGGGRGARWDGSAYGFVTNTVIGGPVTNVAYVDVLTWVTNKQVFTNTIPYTTNTYIYSYVSGRVATNVVVASTTNQVLGVGVNYPLVAYTNVVLGVSTNVAYGTNASGFKTPHYPVQYNVLIGQLDYDYASVAGVPNVLTDPHTLAPNQCADCHVPRYATGAHSNTTGHSFASDNNGCLATCHTADGSVGLQAKIVNLKTTTTNSMYRLVSLLNQWATNIAPAILRTNYAQLSWEFPSPGAFGTKSTNNGVKYTVGPPSSFSFLTNSPTPNYTNDNLQLAYVPQDVRIARFSLYMLYEDQSRGVHNPTYTKALLADAESRVFNLFTAAGYQAAFTANATTGTNSLNVTFSNLGSGSVYAWTYSDGGSDNTANPSHTFGAPGIYSVTCTVDGQSMTRSGFITVK